jgi:hypothetical protein
MKIENVAQMMKTKGYNYSEKREPKIKRESK